mgnify:FL=1
MIHCAMFDCGNVLVQLNMQEFYRFLRSHMSNPDILEPELIFLHLEPISDFDLGKIGVFQMFKRVKNTLDLNVGKNEFLAQSARILNPDRKVAAIGQMLKKNGIKTAVVSNTNNYHFEYLQTAYPDVFAAFDYLMLSFQHGFKKPDHRMWEVPACHLDVSPEECFFVDDLKNNIIEFMKWSKGLGTAHHYDVSDDKLCPNGRLEEERNKLVMRMVNLAMLTPAQAESIILGP